VSSSAVGPNQEIPALVDQHVHLTSGAGQSGDIPRDRFTSALRKPGATCRPPSISRTVAAPRARVPPVHQHQESVSGQARVAAALPIPRRRTGHQRDPLVDAQVCTFSHDHSSI